MWQTRLNNKVDFIPKNSREAGALRTSTWLCILLYYGSAGTSLSCACAQTALLSSVPKLPKPLFSGPLSFPAPCQIASCQLDHSELERGGGGTPFSRYEFFCEPARARRPAGATAAAHLLTSSSASSCSSATAPGCRGR